MNLKFTDKTLILSFIQTKLKEQYNPNVIINGKYYKYFNNNYGFAHYIARYLNTMYPPLDNSYDTTLDDSVFNNTKTISDSISIMNYFLCDNKGNKLINDLIGEDDNNEEEPINDNSVFRNIYGTDLCEICNVNDPPFRTSYTELKAWDERVNGPIEIDNPSIVTNKPLRKLVKKIIAFDYEEKFNTIAKQDRIYTLSEWKTDKDICEIDDLVMSYLLGRTITPNSSMEDIYYVQQLFLENNISNEDKGVWYSNSGNLTKIIKQYQRTHFDPYTTNPLFVTGYFDIFTEATILRDRGEQTYGIHGL